jgi:mRNA-degrading endonuclease RelE of RelBE toxin-antitoxin system
MEIFTTPEFNKLLKTLTKPKYSKIYGTIKKEIDGFFSDYSSFDQVWQKNYMLYENAYIRINKVRLENELQHSGKSGSFRMIIICDKRTGTIGLLYLYPKTGPLRMESTNLDFAKNLVKNYSEVKAAGLLEKYSFEKNNNI